MPAHRCQLGAGDRRPDSVGVIHPDGTALPRASLLQRFRARVRLPVPITMMVIAAGVAVSSGWLISSSRVEAVEREALRIAEVVAQQAQAAHLSAGAEPHGPILATEPGHLYTVRMVSAWNLSPRGGLTDDFEQWAWAELRAQDPVAPRGATAWRPAWRIEKEGQSRTLRYLSAEPAVNNACVTCHAQAEALPQVKAMRAAMNQVVTPERERHQLLGAVEVSVPLAGIEETTGASWHRLALQLGGLILGGLGIATLLVLITQRKGARERARLHFWTHHDRVTSLPNRGFFVHRLETLVQRARDDKGELALVCIDLDRFKDINDSLGHAHGDKVLRKIAERLTDTIQPGDQAFRLSGAQFAVILRDPGELRALQKRVQKLLARITAPMRNGELNTQIGASVGVSRFPHDASTAEALMRATDHAMYRVKENGRNNVSFYQAQLDAQPQLGQALRDGMREAVRKGQFELYYQPVVNVVSRRVVAVEALLRWRHPSHGLVPPNLFLAVAEDIGVLRQVDAWVIQEAVRQRARWTEVGLHPFRVGINLSPLRFQEPGLLSQIDKALAEHGVAPGLLGLEVTEGALARNTQRVAETLTRCHRRGIQIVLDDFGTGFSSMSLLKMFPIDVIKVDKSFVDGLPDDRSDCTLASAIIGLSQSLGLAAVAEGVESLAQFDHLISLGCENMQGFLIARPLPASSLETLVRDGLFNLPLRGVVSDAAAGLPGHYPGIRSGTSHGFDGVGRRPGPLRPADELYIAGAVRDAEGEARPGAGVDGDAGHGAPFAAFDGDLAALFDVSIPTPAPVASIAPPPVAPAGDDRLVQAFVDLLPPEIPPVAGDAPGGWPNDLPIDPPTEFPIDLPIEDAIELPETEIFDPDSEGAGRQDRLEPIVLSIDDAIDLPINESTIEPDFGHEDIEGHSGLVDTGGIGDSGGIGDIEDIAGKVANEGHDDDRHPSSGEPAHAQVLDVEVLVDADPRAFAAEARLLDAAEGGDRRRDDARVDADHA